MKLAVDPHGRTESPILHLLAAVEDSPGGHSVTAICEQSFVVPAIRDSELSDYDLCHLCAQCQKAAKIDNASVLAAAEREAERVAKGSA